VEAGFDRAQQGGLARAPRAREQPRGIEARRVEHPHHPHRQLIEAWPPALGAQLGQIVEQQPGGAGRRRAPRGRRRRRRRGGRRRGRAQGDGRSGLSGGHDRSGMPCCSREPRGVADTIRP
ncbi:MAG: hypothetical protein ACK559_31630, partial [bacterium]